MRKELFLLETLISLILIALSNFLLFQAVAVEFDIKNITNNLPEGITFPPEFDNIPIPSVENVTQVFREKCIKESGSDGAYEQASVSGIIFQLSMIHQMPVFVEL